MGIKPTKHPAIPEPNEHNIVDVLNALKESVEVGRQDVNRGDALDAYVTFRDIVDGNLNAPLSLETIVIGGGGTVGGGGIPGGGSGFPGPVPGDELILPGRPTNVQTTAVWDGIMVSWDWPDQSNPNVSWSRAAIHSSATTSFTDGAVVGYSATNFFIHSGVGLSSQNPQGEVQPGVRYYWVRFEGTDPQTGELAATDWTPFEFEPGVRGQTATTVTLNPDTFGLIDPNDPNADPIRPFVVGQIDGETVVGLDGGLIIDGTITARSIQAGTIGAREINAQEIFAEVLTANAVLSSTISTRPPPDFRLEIHGEGTNYEDFPLWYGRGETGGEDGLFWIRNYETAAGRVSSLFLSGEMYVTGAGKFFAGNVLFDGDGVGTPNIEAVRVEIGGPDTGFLLWAGSGPTGAGEASNPIFYIDNFGNAVFRGTVEAKFVSGEISRTRVINEFSNITAPDGGGGGNYGTWITVGEWEVPEPPFDYGHVPQITVSFSLFGIGQLAGASRIMFRDPQKDGTQWRELSRSVHDISGYGGTFTVCASDSRVFGKSYFRLEIAGFDGHRPTSNRRTGIAMGIR